MIMAPSSISKKFHNHARSNSLPSKSHPLILQCSEHFSRLERLDTSSSSSSSIGNKLCCLEDLHDSVEKMFQLPLIQRVIVQDQTQEKWVDELLDGSLRLLDACTVAKDAILHAKEYARELQSTIRRSRSTGVVEFEAEAKKYLTSRKVVRKAITKALKSLNMNVDGNKANKDDQAEPFINLTRDVQSVTLKVLESLFLFISGPSQSKASSWSLVSKLIQTKRVACTQEADENEFLKVDAAVQCSLLDMKIKSDNASDLLCRLKQLESCTQDLEEGLEKMFKKLIKIRVSILNIINH